MKKRVCCLFQNPKKGITIAWIMSLVFVLVAFIVACVAASTLRLTAGGGTSAAFAGVWTSLLLIALSIMGTIIMRRYKSSLAIGFFLGVIFIMTNQMLILFAIFADHASTSRRPAEEAMAVFCFFLFLVYAVFGSMLAVFRKDIIVNENLADDEVSKYSYPTEQEMLPPPPEYK
jgi:hypothetical protein